VGRTAVVAGTATAVAGGVSRRRSRKYAEKENAAIADQQAAYNQGAADAVPAPSAPGDDDTITKLKQLGELHASGVLTDAEFEAQKAKVLAG
jgi:hypothetical protein